jgi:hypothetical protein
MFICNAERKCNGDCACSIYEINEIKNQRINVDAKVIEGKFGCGVVNFDW